MLFVIYYPQKHLCISYTVAIAKNERMSTFTLYFQLVYQYLRKQGQSSGSPSGSLATTSYKVIEHCRGVFMQLFSCTCSIMGIKSTWSPPPIFGGLHVFPMELVYRHYTICTRKTYGIVLKLIIHGTYKDQCHIMLGTTRHDLLGYNLLMSFRMESHMSCLNWHSCSLGITLS